MLNHKHQLFVLEYQKCLNATKAVKAAGYSSKTAYSIANELLRKPEIRKALSEVMNEHRDNLIADIQERKAFWTATMRDSECDMKHRLRASELLAKSEGDFIEHIQSEVHEVKTLADLMLEDYRNS